MDLMTTLNSHRAIFKEEMGKAVGVKATLHMSDNAKPFLQALTDSSCFKR